MQQAAPGKELIIISETAECENMKLITLEKVYESLVKEQYEIRVPAEVAGRAKSSIERMNAIG